MAIWDYHGSDAIRILLKRTLRIPIILHYLRVESITALPFRLFLLTIFGSLLLTPLFLLFDKITGLFSTPQKARKSFSTIYFFSILSVLTCAFSTNLFQTLPGAEYRLFRGGSESFVTTRLRNDITFLEDLKENGGFIYNGEGENIYRYYSRTGFYTSILKLLEGISRIEPDLFIERTRIILAGLMAAVIASLALYIKNRKGIIASLIFLFPIPFTFWITAPAKDLIWFSFVMYLPFLSSLLLYPLVLKQKIRFKRFLGYIFVVYILNFLHGYEYIASQILSAAIPVFYYELRRKLPFRLLLGRCIYICATGVTAFVLVFTAHFTQLSLFLGTPQDAWAHFLNRTEFYVVEGKMSYPELFIRWAHVPVFYFRSGNFIPGNGSAMLPSNRIGLQQWLNFGNFHLAYVGITFSLGILILAFQRRIASIRMLVHGFMDTISWAITGYVAMVSSWTWFLARHAMATHFHQAGVTFMIPFALVFYILTGYIGQSVLDLMMISRSTPTEDIQ